MYKIVGNDGKTYGPVTAEQIREWIAQRRVEGRTPTLPDGASEWTYLGLLPEFAREFAGTPPVITPLGRTPSMPSPALRTTNGFATAGFICGLASCIICCCGCPFNVLGLIFSIVALVQISGQQEPKQAGWGLALAGLILSALSLLVNFGLSLVQLSHGPASVSWHIGAI